MSRLIRQNINLKLLRLFWLIFKKMERFWRTHTCIPRRIWPKRFRKLGRYFCVETFNSYALIRVDKLIYCDSLPATWYPCWKNILENIIGKNAFFYYLLWCALYLAITSRGNPIMHVPNVRQTIMRNSQQRARWGLTVIIWHKLFKRRIKWNF